MRALALGCSRYADIDVRLLDFTYRQVLSGCLVLFFMTVDMGRTVSLDLFSMALDGFGFMALRPISCMGSFVQKISMAYSIQSSDVS